MTYHFTIPTANLSLGIVGGPAFQVRRLTSVHDICRMVASHYGMGFDDIVSDSRERHVARPRQIVMYLARRHLSMSYPSIGRRLQRDHSTIIHGVETIKRLIIADAEIQADVAALERRLAR